MTTETRFSVLEHYVVHKDNIFGNAPVFNAYYEHTPEGFDRALKHAKELQEKHDEERKKKK